MWLYHSIILTPKASHNSSVFENTHSAVCVDLFHFQMENLVGRHSFGPIIYEYFYLLSRRSPLFSLLISLSFSFPPQLFFSSPSPPSLSLSLWYWRKWLFFFLWSFHVLDWSNPSLIFRHILLSLRCPRRWWVDAKAQPQTLSDHFWTRMLHRCCQEAHHAHDGFVIMMVIFWDP